MVYVTHDQIEALTLADRIAVMKGGVIQQLDEPLTIYNKPSNLFVAGFIGSPSMNFLSGRPSKAARPFSSEAPGSILRVMTAVRFWSAIRLCLACGRNTSRFQRRTGRALDPG